MSLTIGLTTKVILGQIQQVILKQLIKVCDDKLERYARMKKKETVDDKRKNGEIPQQRRRNYGSD